MIYEDLEEKLEIVKSFVTESRELLDDIEPQIIAMEKDAATSGKINKEILNTIFRLFHSIKGSASFLDLKTVIRVTHEAETLLDLFRKGEVSINPQHVDLLIRTSDFVRNILDTVEQQLNDEGYETGATGIIDDLQKTIASVAVAQPVPARAGAAAGAPPLPKKETYEKDSTGSYIPSDSLEEMSLDITPEMVRRFAEEAADLLDEIEKALLVMEKAPEDIEAANQAFRAFHNLKGNAGFFGYADIEELSHQAETLLDKIRTSEKPCTSVAVSFMLITVDILREGMARVNRGEPLELPGKQEIMMYLSDLAGCGQDQEKSAEDLQSSAGDPAGENPCEPYTAPEAARSERVPENTEAGEAEPEAGREKQASLGQQVIRVDIDKLDKLLDLVGELVISEAMVANNQDLKGLQLDRFDKAVLQLDKITRDIQEVAMSMRMIPLSGTFRRMVRLVRDLAQKADKKVNLDIIGEETEVDKTIIEQISDPLVHIIRNAVDHGLESPEERKAAGKPEAGRVTLEAKHSAGEVWIVVEDDGKGLDREKILRKGIERGLIRNEDRDLKDEEVWRLIFEPGFSTAETISNISGRGVGMDVVKRNLEKLRGKIDIRSKAGAGTMFAVRIPLTLAIIEGMVVKVGINRYTIPINTIKESLQPKSEQITLTPDNLEIVRIRGDLLPVIRLHDFYRVRPDRMNLTEGILIVVENDDKKCCLFVDEVIGQQQVVIKGLSGYLGHVRSVSGCAILGDGEISMILDVADLINSAEEVSA